MRCRAARKLVSRRLDGRLTLPGLMVLRQHLAGCPECAIEAARLERAWARLDALPPVRSAPAEFASILESVDSRRSRRPGWLDRLLPLEPLRAGWALAVAASVVAGATTGITLGRAAFGGQVASSAPDPLALSDGFGVLPFGSPAEGLVRAVEGRTE
jgi:anti-sigma factor RsiW